MSLPLVFGAQFCTCEKKKSSLPLDAETFLHVFFPLFPFQFLLIHPSYFMSSILKLWLNWGKSSSQFSVSKKKKKSEKRTLLSVRWRDVQTNRRLCEGFSLVNVSAASGQWGGSIFLMFGFEPHRLTGERFWQRKPKRMTHKIGRKEARGGRKK